jgi:hypothetical protein
VLARVLVAAALIWPLILGAAVWTQQGRERAPIWVGILDAAASRICHQRPERSFFTGTVQWPVCARCSGLYLGAPIGALLALTLRRRPGPEGPGLRAQGPGRHAQVPGRDAQVPRRHATGARDLQVPGSLAVLAIAAVPTLITLALEWLHLAPVSNVMRAMAAVPLGLAIAWSLVRVAQPARADGVH